LVFTLWGPSEASIADVLRSRSDYETTAEMLDRWLRLYFRFWE